MSDADRLALANPKDVALALASALSISGLRPVPAAIEITANIVAERLVKHIEESNFVIIQKPHGVGGPPLGRGYTGRERLLNGQGVHMPTLQMHALGLSRSPIITIGVKSAATKLV